MRVTMPSFTRAEREALAECAARRAMADSKSLAAAGAAGLAAALNRSLAGLGDYGPVVEETAGLLIAVQQLGEKMPFFHRDLARALRERTRRIMTRLEGERRALEEAAPEGGPQ